MLENLTDPTMIAGAFGGTAASGVFMKILATIQSNKERREKYDQERWKWQLTKSYEDVKEVRDAIPERDKTGNFWQGSFIGWTRRLLAWVVIFIFLSIIIGGLLQLPINLVYEIKHHFLGFEWSSYLVKTVQGIVMTPYIRQYCDVVLGFYMGHFTIKSFS